MSDDDILISSKDSPPPPSPLAIFEVVNLQLKLKLDQIRIH